MTKVKTTKRALLLSILSMMLCVAMLAGSTFAWFTDSVTSGKNKIVAGNLDVELEYATSFKEDGTVAEWATVNSETELFKALEKDGTDNLWEPGHTEYVCLRVRNAGTLALKYQFDVNVYGDAEGKTAENEYTNIKGEKFKLSDYLVFVQKDGATKVADRESLWIDDSEQEAKAMGDLSGLGKYSICLDSGATEELTLAVYMPTQVGNDANYRGEEVPEIYLGLSVVATQTPYEEDSFGSDYDEKAELIGTQERVEALVSAGYTEVKDAAGLAEAFKSPDVDKIVVSENISVSAPVTPGSNLTIDLNGNNFESAGRALQITPGNEVVVKNGTLSSKEIATFCSGGDLTLDNVEIEGGGAYAAVFVGNSGTVNISGGSITAEGSANAVWANSGSNVVNIKGTVITSDTNTVVAFENSTINLENCEISTTSGAAYPIATNGGDSKNVELNVKNSKINSSVTGWAAYFPAGTVELLDCTVNGAVVIAGGDVTIDGGTYTAEGSPNEAPYVWDETATWNYCQGFKPGSGAGHMGDSILIVDRRTNGYELKSVTIKNVTFNTRFTDENGNEQTAYAIKYVDLENSDSAKANPVLENNTYNHKLADGTDPLMFLSK